MTSICALIVTYNRAIELVRCINAVLAQSLKVENLIIIDNGSSVETSSKLKEIRILNTPLQLDSSEPFHFSEKLYKGVKIHYYRFKKNMGPAFAFNFGVVQFSKLDCNWLWMMDDDGWPDSICLCNLYANIGSADFINPIVLDSENSAKLSFSLIENKTGKIITKYQDAKKISINNTIAGYANPFNGTFLSKKLVSLVGYPKSEMFGWGVEVEYMERARKLGFKIVTITNAFHYHPSSRLQPISVLKKKWKINYQPDSYINYITKRNEAYISLRYGQKIAFFKSFVLHIFYFLKKLDFKGLTNFLIAVFHGIMGYWENK